MLRAPSLPIRPALAAAGGAARPAAARPAPVLPDRMDQPAQRLDVDVVEPAGRETQHVLLLVVTAVAAGTRRAHAEAENPVRLLWVAGHRIHLLVRLSGRWRRPRC